METLFMYELKNNSYGVNKNIGFTNKKIILILE